MGIFVICLQQVVEPEQPQYVTPVQEIPIEQQVQNLITQENNVILQQAPKVKDLLGKSFRHSNTVKPVIYGLSFGRQVGL